MALSDYDRLVVQRIQTEAARQGFEVLDFAFVGAKTATISYCDASQEEPVYTDTVDLDEAMDLVPGMLKAMADRRTQG